MLLLFFSVVFGVPGAAKAHTELDYSEPEGGASIDEPVSEIVIAFTLPVTVVGNGFEVLDPSGQVIRPTVHAENDQVFVLGLSEPLAGGDVGVRYEVAAEDGHVLADGFSFTVTAETPSTTTTSIPTTTSTESDPTSTASVTTTVGVASIPEDPEQPAGSALPWLVGLSLALLLAAGVMVGLRSRSAP